MALTLAQQAAQAQTQGQQLLSQDQSTAANSQNQYNSYSTQANQANQQSQTEAQYMQGAGSGQNVYNTQQQAQFAKEGYNPQQMVDANNSLFAMNGALNSANTQFNTAGGVGQYGVSAPALASYESSILNPLQTGLGEANKNLGQLNTEYANASNAAGQATTSQVQSEQGALTGFNNAAQGFQAQASAALKNMQFYDNLAQTQGGLNAQEQNYYAQAQQAYATSQNMLAEISQYNTQAALNTSEAAYYNGQVVKTPTSTAPAQSKALSVGQTLQPTMNSSSLQGGSAIPLQGGGLNLQGGGGYSLQ